MIQVVSGIFLVLHGLVHLLYVGQSQKVFELQTGLTWPDNAWTFSRLLGNDATRILASVALIVAAIGFVGGGIGIFASQAWWRPLTLGAVVLSSILYLLLWDGTVQRLDQQGAVGILINIAILVAVVVLGWPEFSF
ncbi:MAG: hypothetical protein H6672_06460 [Anaerolineaceae bacterium]|nr:hypothetical protein [Anaerolineaceae bacterium]